MVQHLCYVQFDLEKTCSNSQRENCPLRSLEEFAFHKILVNIIGHTMYKWHFTISTFRLHILLSNYTITHPHTHKSQMLHKIINYIRNAQLINFNGFWGDGISHAYYYYCIPTTLPIQGTYRIISKTPHRMFLITNPSDIPNGPAYFWHNQFNQSANDLYSPSIITYINYTSSLYV